MKFPVPPVTVIEVDGEGLMSLLDKDVEVFCGVYIYTGKLLGVNDTCIKLGNPRIVYETGDFASTTYKRAESLNKPVQYLMIGHIESFGLSTKS